MEMGGAVGEVAQNQRTLAPSDNLIGMVMKPQIGFVETPGGAPPPSCKKTTLQSWFATRDQIQYGLCRARWVGIDCQQIKLEKKTADKAAEICSSPTVGGEKAAERREHFESSPVGAGIPLKPHGGRGSPHTAVPPPGRSAVCASPNGPQSSSSPARLSRGPRHRGRGLE